MNPVLLLIPVILPAAVGLISLLITDKAKLVKEWLAVLATAASLAFAVYFFGKNAVLSYTWAPAIGLEFSLRLYGFSGFILLASSCFGLLIAVYSLSFMKGKSKLRQYYAYFLLTLAQVNGAVLSDNLILLLFFWEGLLATLYGFIAIGRKEAWKTAMKAFIIGGVTDLCLMFGIIMIARIAGTFAISAIRIESSPLANLAFVLLAIGAVSKAGSMPFHSWIPDAAGDAPLTFMAFMPGAMEKLLGIYFLSRICLDLFVLDPSSWLSTMLMILGAATILLAVMMALVQKDYKKLLSYHAISQVGYMILGIGTMVPAGIIGGIFHMLNNAVYKSGLFLSGGAVEKQAGTTDLNKLGGLARNMPVTFGCFIVLAASISGVPPFNGFFSKELVYDGALERGWIFYAAAALGSFFTAASFLKLGHAAFLGKRDAAHEKTREAPLAMVLPMIVLALACVAFGLFNRIPIDGAIAPVIAGMEEAGHGISFSGFPTNSILVAITAAVLVAAFLNHLFGFRRTGKGLGAVDHIHYLPGLHQTYDAAEKGLLDPYNIAMKGARLFAKLGWAIDKGIDWFYDTAVVSASRFLTAGIRKAHTGNYSLYIVWSLVGMAALVVWMALAF